MAKLKEIVSNFISTEKVQLFHIDEILDFTPAVDAENLFFQAVKVFNEVINLTKEIGIFLVQVELYLELKLGTNKVLGVPSDIFEFINEIDTYCIPEIAISVPEKMYWRPGNVCMPFTFSN